MSDHNIKHPEKNTWIFFTPKNKHTYNSSNIRSIRWEEPEGHEEYELGRLIIRFQTSGTYIYDLPWEMFEEMCNRAFKHRNDQYRLTAGKWYTNKFERRFREIYRREGMSYSKPLYKDTTYEG